MLSVFLFPNYICYFSDLSSLCNPSTKILNSLLVDKTCKISLSDIVPLVWAAQPPRHTILQEWRADSIEIFNIFQPSCPFLFFRIEATKQGSTHQQSDSRGNNNANSKKMGGCVSCVNSGGENTEEARSRAIDKQIREDQKQMKTQVKLLLLGESLQKWI